MKLDPAGAGYTIDRLPALYRQLEDRFAALSGVTHVGMALYSPLEGGGWGECVIQQGHPAPRPGDNCGARWDRISTQFLDSIGVPIVRGRGFTDQDTSSSPQVVVVNETFVRRFFPNQDPIGQHFGIDLPKYSGSWQIVGVFRDFKLEDPHDEVHPVYLRPLSQFYSEFTEPGMRGTETQSMFISAIVLSFNASQPHANVLIRQALAAVDPNLTVMDLRTLDAQIAGNMIQERLIAQLTSLFGILSLVLASFGLYGVMSYFVVRRTSEIGIRMALGATRSSVVTMVMRGVMWQLLIGFVLGIPASLYAGYLMKSMLYGIPGYDWTALSGAPLMLALCATAAGFIPARRAASIEPMQALRTE